MSDQSDESAEALSEVQSEPSEDSARQEVVEDGGDNQEEEQERNRLRPVLLFTIILAVCLAIAGAVAVGVVVGTSDNGNSSTPDASKESDANTGSPPSESPSQAPSTSFPTSSPSIHPTESKLPTTSSVPTISLSTSPSFGPSPRGPGEVPSTTPPITAPTKSLVPTFGANPTTSPSLSSDPTLDTPSLFPTEFEPEDPFDSVNPDDLYKWPSNGQGLQLEVVNALDVEWHGVFDTVVSGWDMGTPDALSLTTSVQSPEPQCSPIQGKMKVCNGNYGATRWRGINEILLLNGTIVSSSARLNEYYLNIASDAQRQYTACHQVGHGFGLPHSDENFFNQDLGNCMDYTSNPENNMQPDTSNFELLSQLYGTIPNNENGRVMLAEDKGESLINEPLPESLLFQWGDLVALLESRNLRDHRGLMVAGWRLLYETEQGEAHSAELGDGYTIQVYRQLIPR